MKNTRLIGILGFATALLAAPLVAMQFTDEVNWTASDFAIAAFLLYGTGLAIEFVLTMVKRTDYRIGICVAILLALAVVWVEMAVGIFGSPIAGS
ncbi:MAG: hypothetical protein EOO50_15060 [Flavobacterium sp.]|uniref:hypothetical protein n=1 Tax=Flavobacterium sp. TaxID=239 RepID=UPI001209B3C2|nr:hypothetical protein [Flavobacterium sp.]RZJ65093.1 MAG: hypothetical protein EOO50_15060 [Flavobacterium sp.]